MRVKVLAGKVEGRDREVTGTVLIDNVEFKFVLCTDDGMTSICIGDESLESADAELYEHILYAVNGAGFVLEN